MRLSNILGSLAFSGVEMKPLMGLNDSIAYVSWQLLLIDHIPLINGILLVQ